MSQEHLFTTRERMAFDHVFYGDDPRLVNTGQPFTVTNVNVTPAIVNQDAYDLPMVSMAGAGAATDGHNHQWSDAGYQLHPGKTVYFYTELASADITNHDYAVWYSALDTTPITSLPTDYIGIRKLSGETRFRLVSRKASGTELAIDLNMPVVANDTLYCFGGAFTLDLTTAGKARAQIFYGVGLSPGGQMTKCWDDYVMTQAPDTVDLAFQRAWRAGSTVTTVGLFGGCRFWADA